MSAEVEAGGRAGRGGLGAFARLQTDFRNAFQSAGEQGRAYAERIIARLDQINENIYSIADPETERTNRGAAILANATQVIADGRPGYMGHIERIAVVADAATTVDIHVGSATDAGFRHRLNFAAAGRDQAAVEIDVPEGAQVIAVVGAGSARVNVQIRRQKA